MGIILHDSGPGWDMVVRETTETFEELAAVALPPDLRSAMRFRSTERRRMHLAARAALRELLPGGEISYDVNGAPYIGGRTGLHVGLSHCKGAAAAIVADRNCAVDIEKSDRDFSRAAPRFLSEGERQVPGNTDAMFLPAVWCAKETLYKYGRMPGTDFLRDIDILSFDAGAGAVTARMKDIAKIEVAVLRAGGFIVCHIPA